MNNSNIEEQLAETIEELEKENEDLKSRIIDLAFEQNYSIEKELAELVRNLYFGVNQELHNKSSKLTKKEILHNLKDNLIQFSKDYKFKL